jgi:hypothetical protein
VDSLWRGAGFVSVLNVSGLYKEYSHTYYVHGLVKRVIKPIKFWPRIHLWWRSVHFIGVRAYLDADLGLLFHFDRTLLSVILNKIDF